MVSRVASVQLGGRQREQLRRTVASDLDNSVNTGANVARRVLSQAKIGWLDGGFKGSEILSGFKGSEILKGHRRHHRYLELVLVQDL